MNKVSSKKDSKAKIPAQGQVEVKRPENQITGNTVRTKLIDIEFTTHLQPDGVYLAKINENGTIEPTQYRFCEAGYLYTSEKSAEDIIYDLEHICFKLESMVVMKMYPYTHPTFDAYVRDMMKNLDFEHYELVDEWLLEMYPIGDKDEDGNYEDSRIYDYIEDRTKASLNRWKHHQQIHKEGAEQLQSPLVNKKKGKK